MNKHIIIGFVVTGAIAMALSGCGQKPASSGTTSQGSGSQNPANNSVISPAPKQDVTPATTPAQSKSIQAQIKAYYGDEQATKLVEKEVTINYPEEKEKYTTALWTLKKAPADSKLVPLADALGFKSAVLKDKKLTLDITLSGEGRLGAPGEAMLLQAIQKTLFQFPEVDAIDILVDGKPVESLMGHMDLPHPMKRGQ
ncbi:Sporulation and spore germination [Paenibacillus sp. 1_12]|uniref:GerMN domain-containing protein n=1 Tax=Paenibacillus sp. 1_12 TaxID=1566278 RepID=UPI0008EB94B5|nr:GerMN domain-containing protein [Paenibacillus sp. 1_12]SFL74447.1 Sporulation and spore germination [Paenibacillus sp. 1_12]